MATTGTGTRRLPDRLPRFRTARGWSQQQLAERAGLSRAAVSAIETGRVVPSVAAALALAAALECRVEELFGRTGTAVAPEWAWRPSVDPTPFWSAAVDERTILYPVERTAVGMLPPDGVARGGELAERGRAAADDTLVVAGCDPAVGLLVAEIARGTEIRVIPLVRSSAQALDLLRRRLIHVAGLHWEDATRRDGNSRAVRQLLGGGHTLVRVARWQEGIALAPGLGIRSVAKAVTARLTWVGREQGSGARRCLDWILAERARSAAGVAHVASGHHGVVEAIRSGFAQAGVCVRLPAAEAGLEFLTAREEDYDLCFRSEMRGDPRIRALVASVRARSLRRVLGELPGYDSAESGEMTAVRA